MLVRHFVVFFDSFLVIMHIPIILKTVSNFNKQIKFYSKYTKKASKYTLGGRFFMQKYSIFLKILITPLVIRTSTHFLTRCCFFRNISFVCKLIHSCVKLRFAYHNNRTSTTHTTFSINTFCPKYLACVF